MLNLIHTYPLPEGGRHLAILTIPSASDDHDDTFVVLDIPIDPGAHDDVHMVGKGHATHGAAWSAAIDHAIRSQRLGRPAVPRAHRPAA